jgi:hypothetical protein
MKFQLIYFVLNLIVSAEVYSFQTGMYLAVVYLSRALPDLPFLFPFTKEMPVSYENGTLKFSSLIMDSKDEIDCLGRYDVIVSQYFPIFLTEAQRFNIDKSIQYLGSINSEIEYLTEAAKEKFESVTQKFLNLYTNTTDSSETSASGNDSKTNTGSSNGLILQYEDEQESSPSGKDTEETVKTSPKKEIFDQSVIAKHAVEEFNGNDVTLFIEDYIYALKQLNKISTQTGEFIYSDRVLNNLVKRNLVNNTRAYINRQLDAHISDLRKLISDPKRSKNVQTICASVARVATTYTLSTVADATLRLLALRNRNILDTNDPKNPRSVDTQQHQTSIDKLADADADTDVTSLYELIEADFITRNILFFADRNIPDHSLEYNTLLVEVQQEYDNQRHNQFDAKSIYERMKAVSEANGVGWPNEDEANTIETISLSTFFEKLLDNSVKSGDTAAVEFLVKSLSRMKYLQNKFDPKNFGINGLDIDKSKWGDEFWEQDLETQVGKQSIKKTIYKLHSVIDDIQVKIDILNYKLLGEAYYQYISFELSYIQYFGKIQNKLIKKLGAAGASIKNTLKGCVSQFFNLQSANPITGLSEIDSDVYDMVIRPASNNDDQATGIVGLLDLDTGAAKGYEKIKALRNEKINRRQTRKLARTRLVTRGTMTRPPPTTGSTRV